MVSQNLVFRLTVPIFLLVFQVFASQDDRLAALKFKNVMTAAEFKATGLSKLTSEELGALDKWLQQFTMKVVEVTSI